MGVKMRVFEEKGKEKNKDEDKKKNEDEDVEQIQGMSNWGAGGSLFKRNTPSFHISDQDRNYLATKYQETFSKKWSTNILMFLSM